MNYYNEIDPYCAAWLQNLMDAGEIPRGVIDTRSIEDVTPADLAGFTQCHFFAGLGGWALALRLAGWPDSRSAWTGSCPCQPFSAAGKGAGFADERHLWPAWQHLIAQCRPAVVFGEQVASKAVDAWIDLVHADLEGMGYAFGCVPFPSAGVGAPHIRDRTYWVAHAGSEGLSEQHGRRAESARFAAPDGATDPRRCKGCDGLCTTYCDDEFDTGLADEWVADASSIGWIGWKGIQAGRVDDRAHAGRIEDHDGLVCGDEAGVSRIERPGPTNGFWRAADWLGCTDGKLRPVEPGTFPLAHGIPNRVGRLRAYGNAISAPAATAFIQGYLEARA